MKHLNTSVDLKLTHCKDKLGFQEKGSLPSVQMKFRSIPGETGALVPGIISNLDPAEHLGGVDTSLAFSTARLNLPG